MKPVRGNFVYSLGVNFYYADVYEIVMRKQTILHISKVRCDVKIRGFRNKHDVSAISFT